MRRLTHLIVLVAFVFSCGGQWAALQCVAWGNMIREYSEMVPLTQAVQMTFSGQYPCPICKAITEKKNSEQQKMLALDKYEKKFVLPLEAKPLLLKTTTVEFAETSVFFSSRSEAPISPPPRSALS